MHFKMVRLLCLIVVFSLTVIKTFGNITTKENHSADDELEDQPFVASNEWQRIKPGQAIPAGLHVKVDLAGGGTFAKLMEKDEKPSSSLQVVPNSNHKEELSKPLDRTTVNELKRQLKQLKHENKDKDAEEKEKEKQLKREEIASFMNQPADIEVMMKLLSHAKDVNQEQSVRQFALVDLEYYVHQIDNANDFIRLGAFEHLKDLMNETNEAIRTEALHIIGTAVQNNIRAKKKCFHSGLMTDLIRLLSDPLQADAVKRKSLYALSCLIRHYADAQAEFFKFGGVQLLRNILAKESHSSTLKMKAVRLVTDLATERQADLPTSTKLSDVELPLVTNIRKTNWCSLIGRKLEDAFPEDHETVLNAMHSLRDVCHQQFSASSVQAKLLQLKEKYEKLLAGEKPNEGEWEHLWQALHNQIEHLLAAVPERWPREAHHDDL